MSIMMDIVGAFVLVGMLMLTVMGVNINMSDETYKGLTELNLQTQSIQLARIFEFDFYKAGFNVTKPHVIAIADTSRFKFYTNLYDIPGKRDSIEYDLGSYVTSTTNPNDKSLYRYENTTRVFINFSVVRFKLSYYNSNDVLIPTPITGSNLDSIKALSVLLTLQSPEPFDTTRSGGAKYVTTYYSKRMYPRNL